MALSRNAWRLVSKVKNMQPAGRRASWNSSANASVVMVLSTRQPWTHPGTQNLYWAITSIRLAGGHVCPHRHFLGCWWVGHPTPWQVVLGGMRRARDPVSRSLLLGLCFSACFPVSAPSSCLSFLQWWTLIRKYEPNVSFPPRAVLIIIFTTGLESNLGKPPVSFCMWAALISHLKTKDSFPRLPEHSSIAWC